MKIGFVGTHSTGKTSLAKALIERLPEFTLSTGASRWVKEMGFPINEDGTDQAQTLIFMRHLHNMIQSDNVISDRTVYDGMAYSKWTHEHGQLTDAGLEVAKNYFKFMSASMYDLLLYVPIEFDVEDDGVRSIDENFRNDIDRMIFESYNHDFDATITGTLEERVEQVLKLIKKYDDD